MLKVAFASTDRTRVNQHFGAAEGFVIYEVTPDKATLVGVAEFAEEAMDGNEDKLAAKIDFLDGCAAVYVMAIGASAIKKLMAKGVQPIRVDEQDGIDELLKLTNQALTESDDVLNKIFDLLDAFFELQGELPRPASPSAAELLAQLPDVTVTVRGHGLVELLAPAYRTLRAPA